MRTTPKRTLEIRHETLIPRPRKPTPLAPRARLGIEPHRNGRHAPRLPAEHYLRRLAPVLRRYRPETHRPAPDGEIRRRPDLRRGQAADGRVRGVPRPGFVRARVAVAGLHDVERALACVVEGGAGARDGAGGFGPAVGGVDDGAVGEDAVGFGWEGGSRGVVRLLKGFGRPGRGWREGGLTGMKVGCVYCGGHRMCERDTRRRLIRPWWRR